MKTGKIAKKVIFVISALILLWIAISFIDVVLHNNPTTSNETLSWNFFDICLRYLWR